MLLLTTGKLLCINKLNIASVSNHYVSLFSMLVLIAEGSTPSLNLSWLLHQLKLTNTVAFQFAVMSLLLLFFLLRVLLGPYMVIHCYINADEWGTDSFHRALFYFNISIIFLFCLLNFYWFYKLIEVAMKANKKKD